MKHETGICYNCGADEGLHQFGTLQCPRHGIEETRFDKLEGKYYPQQWDNTTFEDNGLRKLNDAAPELLEALKDSLQILEQTLNYRNANMITGGNVFLTTAIELSKATIKKATE